jgi:hypothetical protein
MLLKLENRTEEARINESRSSMASSTPVEDILEPVSRKLEPIPGDG